MADSWSALAATRAEVHRVAAHVLARRRQVATGRIGLRATPGGIGTPAFGPDPEVVRIAGAHLVRETRDGTATMPLGGSSLRELAGFAGVDIDAPLDLGKDTPEIGDPDAPLDIDEAMLASLTSWYSLGWRSLDGALAELGAGAAPSTIQIWPEHFDAAVDIAVAPGRRVNLGASPGDAFSGEPYLYVGPWGPERPGGPGYWNAPFGAYLGRSDVPDVAAGVAFLLAGVRLLRT